MARKEKKKNMNFELKDCKNIKYIDLESINSTFRFSCDFKNLKKIKFLDDVVLYFKFENGDLRIDITKSELKDYLETNKSINYTK